VTTSSAPTLLGSISLLSIASSRRSRTGLVEHPEVVDVRWQMLATRDAHDLYAKLGYRPLDDPARWMHRGQPNR